MRIHLNIGSNLGDRHGNIGRAIAMLARMFGGRMILSDYFESEPWGFESPNTFVNRGVLVITDIPISPLAVLDITQHVERTVCAAPHRDSAGAYIDRVIDIDIIDIDHMRLSGPRLTLPHPRALLRPFVTGPLSQLDPATLAMLKGCES